MLFKIFRKLQYFKNLKDSLKIKPSELFDKCDFLKLPKFAPKIKKISNYNLSKAKRINQCRPEAAGQSN